MRFINVGFNNMVLAERVVALISPDSAPIKRLIQDSRDTRRLLDCTCGRRTRSVIICDSGHVVMSAQTPETISGKTGDKLPEQDEQMI